MLHALRSGALALAMLPAAYVSTLAQGSQGSSPLTPAKGGTNSAYVGFAGPSSTVKTFTLPNASDTIATLAAIQTFSAAKTFSAATLLLAGSSSGATTLNASAVASGTLTLPAATDTLVGRATTDTLTNKTLTTPEITTSLRVTGTTGETLTVGGNYNRLYLSPGSNVPVEILNSAGTSSGKRFYTTDTQVTLYSSGTSRVNVTGTGFTLTPNGTNTRFQISDTSLQLHYDNIVLAPAANSPGVTWKHVDPLGGLDKPFGNIGVATTDANKFRISSGPTAANIPANNDLIFGTYNATTEIERVKLAGGAATVNLELLNGTGLTVPGTVNFSGLTASLPLGLDSSKNVVSYNTTGVAGSAIALANSPTLTSPTISGPAIVGTADIQQAHVFSGDISPSQITSNQNDYAPTGFSTASVVRLSTDASRTVTGLAGGADGRTIYLYNTGSSNLVLSSENASSTAANRFGFSGDRTLAGGDGVTLIYDSTASRWRLVGSNPSTGGGGGGDASGPASSTDNALARFDGTTGKLIQNSEIMLGDSDGKLSRTAGISVSGTNTNNNAAAGYVGEFVESSVPIGSAVALTTGVAANITSISLTAGDWDVWGNFAVGATTTSVLRCSISTTSATIPTAPNGGGSMLVAGDQSGAVWVCGQRRVSVASTTTVYLVTQNSFTGSGTAYGYIGARRAR